MELPEKDIWTSSSFPPTTRVEGGVFYPNGKLATNGLQATGYCDREGNAVRLQSFLSLRRCVSPVETLLVKSLVQVTVDDILFGQEWIDLFWCRSVGRSLSASLEVW
jgi:hypothetical protein